MVNSLQQALAVGFLLVVVMSAVFLLAAFYQQRFPSRLKDWERRLARAWEFTPENIGGFSWSQLALASLLSLFLEMLMIRWVAAEVSAFAYFKNVVDRAALEQRFGHAGHDVGLGDRLSEADRQGRVLVRTAAERARRGLELA